MSRATRPTGQALEKRRILEIEKRLDAVGGLSRAGLEAALVPPRSSGVATLVKSLPPSLASLAGRLLPLFEVCGGAVLEDVFVGLWILTPSQIVRLRRTGCNRLVRGARRSDVVAVGADGGGNLFLFDGESVLACWSVAQCQEGAMPDPRRHAGHGGLRVSVAAEMYGGSERRHLADGRHRVAVGVEADGQPLEQWARRAQPGPVVLLQEGPSELDENVAVELVLVAQNEPAPGERPNLDDDTIASLAVVHDDAAERERGPSRPTQSLGDKSPLRDRERGVVADEAPELSVGVHRLDERERDEVTRGVGAEEGVRQREAAELEARIELCERQLHGRRVEHGALRRSRGSGNLLRHEDAGSATWTTATAQRSVASRRCAARAIVLRRSRRREPSWFEARR